MREETMKTSKAITGTCALLALTLAACGSPSNSETNRPGGTNTAGSGGSAPGTGGGTPGTGGSSGAGGAGTAGTGGASGSGGSPGTRPDGGTRAPDTGGGSSDASAAPGACPARTSLTLAVHIIMDASWPGTTAASAGMDKIHLWNLTKLNVNGTEVSGNETRS